MKSNMVLAASASLFLLAGAADAHVGGGGGARAGGARAGGRVASPSFNAPHYSGGVGNVHAGAGSNVGYASHTNVGNRVNSPTNIGNTNTRVGNNTRIGGTNQIGNNNVDRTRVGNNNIGNTNIGNSRTNTINSGNRTTNINGSNDGNRVNSGNRFNNDGNRSFTNNGTMVGRETNITTVNARGAGSTNINRNGGWNGTRGAGWNGWNGYRGGAVGGWGGGWNRPGGWGWNRPWSGGYGWYRGGWRGWSAWPSVWGGVGGVAAVPIPYANPYYVPAPVAVPVPVAVGSPAPVIIQGSTTYAVPPALDYSRPIAQPTQVAVDQTDTDVVKSAQAHLDAGRTAFQKGDYKSALIEADKAIEVLPGDTNSHEFRALCLFAQKKYTDAAATIYAVLMNGPGWDANTMNSFYSDPATYQKQLRDLVAFAKANPNDSAAHFLLAYEYLVQDQRPQALDQLRLVEKLTPKDQLTKSIADALAKDQSKG